MVNLETVKECWAGLVGFRDSDRSCISNYSGSLTGSTSSVFVTSEAGITPTNINACKPKDYSSTSDYIVDVITRASQEVAQEFVNRHKELTRARTLLDNVNPVKGVNIMTNQVTKSGRFVGIMIQPTKSDSIVAVLKYIGTQFNSVNSALTLYLYETSQVAPIATLTLTGHNSILSLQWFESTMTARYRSNTGGTGQKFLLGYYENDLTGNAVSTTLHNCSSCEHNALGTDWIEQMQKQVYIQGFSFPSTALSGTNLPDITKIGYSEETYGLHLRFYTTCDITDVLCDNKSMFAMPISKKAAMTFYLDFANNSNVSRESDMSRDRAMTNYAVAKEQYDDHMKNIRIDFTDIDKKCLPCSQRELRTTYIS